jgi:hypothetical protein
MYINKYSNSYLINKISATLLDGAFLTRRLEPTHLLGHRRAMKYKGFNVTVHTSPQAGTGIQKTTVLTEYPPNEPLSNNTLSTYIASQAGQQFSIHVENESDSDASILFYVDGQMASCLLCHAKPKHNSVVCHGVQPEAGLLRKFVFRKVNLTGTKSCIVGAI